MVDNYLSRNTLVAVVVRTIGSAFLSSVPEALPLPCLDAAATMLAALANERNLTNLYVPWLYLQMWKL